MNNLLIITMSVMLVINLIMFFLYERTKPTPETILPLVVVVVAASLGRVMFAVIPQVQPVTTLVIMMGVVYGARTGYMCGALCALVSNLFLGQGPWTLFQMCAWGVVGLFAGLIGKAIRKLPDKAKLGVLVVYSVFAAYLFSLITDLLSISYLAEAGSFAAILTVFVAGFLFQTGHAVGNVVFMVLFYQTLNRRLVRVKNII